MQIAAGETYKIIGSGGEWTYCRVSDVYQYKGHYGVFGLGNKHQIHLPWRSGYRDIPDRPMAFPVLMTGESSAHDRFYDQLFMGLPTYLEAPNPLTDKVDRLRIANAQPLKGWHYYGETVANIDIARLKMVPMQLIDLWEHWQRTGGMPAGYEEAKTTARLGVN